VQTHALLESRNLIVGQGVGLGDDRNEVDLGVESAHDLDVQRLQGVTGRLDKVHTGVHTIVDNVHAIDLILSVEVSIEALLNVLDNRPP
jgi:hypothetical protein